MNRLTLLITGSLTALILAGCSGLWLLWQSWETGQKLEQKNRELLASLEASRIRLENFCEYPVEALCNTSAAPSMQSGSLETAMAQVFPEKKNLSPSEKDIVQTRPHTEEKAEGKAGEQSPEELSDKKYAETALDGNAATGKLISELRQEQPVPTHSPVPAQEEQNSGKLADSSGNPAEMATPAIPSPRASIITENAPQPEHTPLPALTPSPQQLPLASSGEKTPGSESTTDIPGQQDTRIRRTWSSYTLTAQYCELRISGEGERFEASAEQAEKMFRITLPGRWRIYEHRLQNDIIESFHCDTGLKNTILTFSLKKDAQTILQQQDARTIIIKIKGPVIENG